MSGLGTAMAGGKPPAKKRKKPTGTALVGGRAKGKGGHRPALRKRGAPTASEQQPQEFYPTPALVTEALLDFWKPISGWIWEPACGDGAMARVLQAHGYSVICSDLVDRGCPGAMVQDFLKMDRMPGASPAIAVVTNPPFSLAQAFVEHALGALGVKEMALLVKATWWHTKSRLGIFDRFPPRYVLPVAFRADFLGKGSPVMDVTWCVWQGPTRDTIIRPLPKPAKQRELFAP